MNTNNEWIRITYCENIPLREGRAVPVGDLDIAIFNLGDQFLAIDNRCPHSGGPLADGIVSGTTVVCPLHAWKVDLECGAVMRLGETVACVRSYRTKTDHGIISIEIPKPTSIEDPVCSSEIEAFSGQ